MLESMLERDQGKVQMMDYFSVNKIQCIARILKSTERVKGVLVTEAELGKGRIAHQYPQNYWATIWLNCTGGNEMTSTAAI